MKALTNNFVVTLKKIEIYLGKNDSKLSPDYDFFPHIESGIGKKPNKISLEKGIFYFGFKFLLK